MPDSQTPVRHATAPDAESSDAMAESSSGSAPETANDPYLAEAPEVYPSPQLGATDDELGEDGQPRFDFEMTLQMPDMQKIVMWPGVRVGYVRKLNIEEGGAMRSLYMKTLSLDPPIFGVLRVRACAHSRRRQRSPTT